MRSRDWLSANQGLVFSGDNYLGRLRGIRTKFAVIPRCAWSTGGDLTTRTIPSRIAWLTLIHNRQSSPVGRKRLSKQPIRTRYLGHVTGYQPIREQYFLTVPTCCHRNQRDIPLGWVFPPDSNDLPHTLVAQQNWTRWHNNTQLCSSGTYHLCVLDLDSTCPRGRVSRRLRTFLPPRNGIYPYRMLAYLEQSVSSKQPIRTRYLGHVTGY